MKKFENQLLAAAPASIPHYMFADDGVFPNSELPVLFYKSAFQLPNDDAPGVIEEVFDENDWTNSWRDGIYTYQHYHSVTHEVLGVYSGDCQVLLGGEKGITLLLEKGDVLIIPAGVAHTNIQESANFKCIGAYPEGRKFDINHGKPFERPHTDENIKKVPLPKTDPLYGSEGCLHTYWKK